MRFISSFIILYLLIPVLILGQNQTQLPDFILKEALDRADIVIIGEVTSIEKADVPQAKIQAPDFPNRPFSFPPSSRDWHRANIFPAYILKGENLVKSTDLDIGAYFINSTNVSYKNTPKLSIGQIGIFLIRIEGSSQRFKDLTDFDHEAKTISGSSDFLTIQYLKRVMIFFQAP